MDKKKKAEADDEEVSSRIAAMSNNQRVKFWERAIDTNRELAGELFVHALLWDAAAGYEHQGEEDHPTAAGFSEEPPPPANNPGSPPLTTLAPATDNRTPLTTAGGAAQGKKPLCAPTAPLGTGKESSEDQKPQQPSMSKPPQNSFQTVSGLCAPPHLARGVKSPSPSTECTPQGNGEA